MAPAILPASGIYAIVNTATGKRYIGSAVDIKKRWSRHRLELKKGTHHSSKLQRAWNKHGVDSFVFEVIERVLAADLIAREQVWIDRYGSCAKGYNSRPTAGSMLGHRHSKKTVELCRAAKVGVKFTDEHKAKLSAWQVGRKQSEETKAKRSAALKGRPRAPEVVQKMGRKNSPETIEKRRASLTGLKRSPEAVEKMRLAMLGRRLSPETIAKRTATWRANRLSKQAIKG